MTDLDLTVIVPAGAVGAAFIKLIHWSMIQWVATRRDDRSAADARAAADREASSRMGDRQNAAIDRLTVTVGEHTARDLAAQAEVSAAVARLEGKVDAAFDWHERTPVEAADDFDFESPTRPSSASERRRKRTHPQGFRPPRSGTHND